MEIASYFYGKEDRLWLKKFIVSALDIIQMEK